MSGLIDRLDEFDLTEYEKGYIAGLATYAWWKDGVQYVGSTGTTLELAIARFLRERGRDV